MDGDYPRVLCKTHPTPSIPQPFNPLVHPQAPIIALNHSNQTIQKKHSKQELPNRAFATTTTTITISHRAIIELLFPLQYHTPSILRMAIPQTITSTAKCTEEAAARAGMGRAIVVREVASP